MSGQSPGFRTELGRVRGLGSAKEGAQHWWMQRLTALALVPLAIWLVVSLVALTGADHAVVAGWLGRPMTVGLMILTVCIALHHAHLGIQIVIEDYVHREWVKIGAILLVKAASLVLGLAAALALLSVAFGR